MNVNRCCLRKLNSFTYAGDVLDSMLHLWRGLRASEELLQASFFYKELFPAINLLNYHQLFHQVTFAFGGETNQISTTVEATQIYCNWLFTDLRQ